MSAPRQPKYLQKKQYSHLKERNKEIYLSSCWFKFHWSWDKTKAFFNSMVDGKEYFICSLPYQLPIKENLLDKRQVEEEMSESDFNEILWLMEMEAQFYGESDKAYFKFKDLEVNRTLSIPIYPKPFYDIFKDNKFKYVKKGHDEIRIVSCDIAMMSGKKNDASIYTVMRLIPMKNKVGKYYSREIVYIESMEGGHSTAQATRIRQLVDDFECDYICIDCQGVGMGVYDVLVQPIYDKERMKEYEPWTAFNNKEMEERCAYPDAPKRIFAMKAYGEINSECAISFKDNLSKGKIKLLINENDCKEVLKKIKGYGTLDIEEKVQLELPYRQTTSLISEMVNLEVDIHPQTRQIKLKEQSGKRKDRWSSASYGNYLANILEKDLVKVSDYDVNRNYVFI